MGLLRETRDRTEPLPAGVDLHVAGERTEYCFGLDLGQKRDYTALALVERSEVVYRSGARLRISGSKKSSTGCGSSNGWSWGFPIRT